MSLQIVVANPPQTRWVEKAYKPPTPFAYAMGKVVEAHLAARSAKIALCAVRDSDPVLTEELRKVSDQAMAKLDEALLNALRFAETVPELLAVRRATPEGSKAEETILQKMAAKAGWH